MAFKIDFSAIGNKSPEQRQADEKAAFERLEARVASLTSERKAMVNDLLANIQTIPDKDARFVRGLEYKSTTYDLNGHLGGELANLTDRQIDYLNGLHKKYAARAPAAPRG